MKIRSPFAPSPVPAIAISARAGMSFADADLMAGGADMVGAMDIFEPALNSPIHRTFVAAVAAVGLGNPPSAARRLKVRTPSDDDIALMGDVDNGAALRRDENPRATSVTLHDLVASNGVRHVIDPAMLPQHAL